MVLCSFHLVSLFAKSSKIPLKDFILGRIPIQSVKELKLVIKVSSVLGYPVLKGYNYNQDFK